MKPRYTSIVDGKPVFNESIIGLINRAKQRPNIPAYARLLQLYNQIMGINWGTVTVTIGRKKLNSGTHTQLRLDFDAAVDNARRHEAGMRRARIAHSDDELEHGGVPRGRKKRVTDNSKGVKISGWRDNGRSATLDAAGESQWITEADFLYNEFPGMTLEEIKRAQMLSSRNPQIASLINQLHQLHVGVGRKPTQSKEELAKQLRKLVRADMRDPRYTTVSGPRDWSRQYATKRNLMHMSDDELEHFGIQGMKWGVRRYQNEDGSLTEAGRKRYGVLTERYDKAANRYERASAKGNAVKAAKAGVKLTKANADLHSLNQRLGYEAKYPDKDPLRGMQNKLPDKPQQSQINYNPQQSQNNNNNQQQFQKPIKDKPEKPYWKKKVKDMDDAELKAYAERLATLEKLKGSSAIKPQTPVKDNKPQGKDVDKKTNNGQNFVIQKGKKFGNKIVDTMVEGAGKRIGEYYLDRLMGDKFKKNN